MTTTTEHVQAILETLDRQLLNPLARDVTITMSRDEAAAFITATSEETTLTVWSAGFAAGYMTHAYGNAGHDHPQCHLEAIWSDPAARETALYSARNWSNHDIECGCGAPWHGSNGPEVES